MGELQTEPFQFAFNGFLKVAFQGSRITSDAGLILIRELDERLGLATLISEHLSDSRQGLNTQFGLVDLLRQSVYSRLAGYEDLNDAVRVSAYPTFRLIGSPKRWDRGAALTSTLHWFETDLLTRGENLLGLMAVNREMLARAGMPTRAGRIVLDMDSSESPVHGAQEGSAYNGHFASVCYHPLFLAISEFPKWRKYLIYLSFLGKSSVRPVQVGGFDVNIVIHRSTAVRGRGGPVRHHAWPPSLGAILSHTDGPCGS